MSLIKVRQLSMRGFQATTVAPSAACTSQSRQLPLAHWYHFGRNCKDTRTCINPLQRYSSTGRTLVAPGLLQECAISTEVHLGAPAIRLLCRVADFPLAPLTSHILPVMSDR